MMKNGIGAKCGVPPNIMMLDKKSTMEDARDEAALVIFDCIERLLEKTKISTKQIDVLVTNCSLFCPTPSLSSMVVNKFKLKSGVHSFSLGGMGCSASPIGAELCCSMLQNKKLKYALLISTENVTHNFYMGKDRSMLLPIALFRMGCAAILLTNVKSGSKYEIEHIERTHIGSVDDAHRCIY